MKVKILTGVDAIRALAHPNYGRWDRAQEFRGDAAPLEPGLREIEGLTGVSVIGVLPYFTGSYILEEEIPWQFRTSRVPPPPRPPLM